MVSDGRYRMSDLVMGKGDLGRSIWSGYMLSMKWL